MLDTAAQREVATRMVKAFASQGVHVVLVGSTAVVALRLMASTSKDADALAPVGLGMDEARSVMTTLADQLGLTMSERGWGTLSLVKEDGAKELWRMDLLVPEEGPIPAAVASLVRRDAVSTDIGDSATTPHIFAMKAVAWGDSRALGDPEGAAKYRADLEGLRRALRKEPDWKAVEELLDAYPSARARWGREILRETFGVDFEDDPGMDAA